jgi:hypothetical protein
MLEFGKPETLQSGAIRVCAKAKLLVGHIVLDSTTIISNQGPLRVQFITLGLFGALTIMTLHYKFVNIILNC